MPVRLPDFGGANGVLSLNGSSSVLHVASDKPLRPLRGRNGWFDLKAQMPDGRVALLHNALLLSSNRHHWENDGGTPHSAEIFPNIVIDDVRGMDSNFCVRRVMFRITGLRNFFYYQHTEPLLSFEGSVEQVSALKAMRYERDSGDDLFDPKHVYVVHRYPTYFTFKVCDRTYEVWAGGRERFGDLHELSYEVYPTASILFDQAVDLETAFNRVWEWRQLFSQLAMLPLAVEEIVVQGTSDLTAPTANVYISNSVHKRWPTKGYYSLSPREQPYNDWCDRKKLGACHKRWLEMEPKRKRFRNNLHRVLQDLASRTDAADVVSLAAGIDSLRDLQSGTEFPVDVIAAMATAAESVSQEMNNPLPLERIRGVLGTLRRPSLALKIKELGRLAATSLEEIDLVASAATQVRNRVAHGGSTVDQSLPAMSPAIHALAALCARYDLETCGFKNSATVGQRTMAARWFGDNVKELKNLNELRQ